ncbi:hypothetical protein GUJ93_ZPchr0002g23131 [Zizania palustris]|uniref:Uncharacterized protein n=1 Tax=Zizania palustris TaxID=103762 RepID=A0A8J5VR51_ZIZPA|nr:hypothetical protein GUJ93_ZPchr0002g23131 [Zizania palustris]
MASPAHTSNGTFSFCTVPVVPRRPLPPRRPSRCRRHQAAPTRVSASPGDDGAAAAAAEAEQGKSREEKGTRRCLRCGRLYRDEVNSPTACSFHGHVTGEKGLFSLSPPHQGIDGEWSDKSGVIVYRWNDRGNRPNTGRANWKGRWSCCQERDQAAPPCRRGRHVSYDDGYTLF